MQPAVQLALVLPTAAHLGEALGLGLLLHQLEALHAPLNLLARIRDVRLVLDLAAGHPAQRGTRSRQATGSEAVNQSSATSGAACTQMRQWRECSCCAPLLCRPASAAHHVLMESRSRCSFLIWSLSCSPGVTAQQCACKLPQQRWRRQQQQRRRWPWLARPIPTPLHCTGCTTVPDSRALARCHSPVQAKHSGTHATARAQRTCDSSFSRALLLAGSVVSYCSWWSSNTSSPSCTFFSVFSISCCSLRSELMAAGAGGCGRHRRGARLARGLLRVRCQRWWCGAVCGIRGSGAGGAQGWAGRGGQAAGSSGGGRGWAGGGGGGGGSRAMEE